MNMVSGSQSMFTADQMRTEKRGVALNSVFAAIGITVFKAIVGVTTGSLGILSEAAHSALDLVAAVVTLFSVRVSDKPADADHQYGHEKVENFSAFIETALLFLTCIWIIYEAIRRLFFHKGPEVEPSIAAFVVMFFSIGMDFWRSRALKKIADKYDSQALQADALHFSTDIWSSSVVIVGLFFVQLAQWLGKPWLKIADPIAALFVAGVVIWVSARLGRQTIDALLDAAPSGTRAQILGAVAQVDGVLEVDRARIRRAGARYFVDLTLGLTRTVTFQKSQQVVSNVVGAVHEILPGSDVVVHSIPRASGAESIFDRIRSVGTRWNLNIHDISIQDLSGRLHVEQHLEMDENLKLKEAHDRVTLLETEIKAEVPEISSILTHIESEPATIESGNELKRDPKLESRLQQAVKDFPEVIDVHDVKVKRVRNRLYVSLHCTMEDNLPLSRVHDLSTELELKFKQQTPELFRILIHTEPQTDNLR
jgi:cation diffusion facilitator family transporter